MLPERPAGQLSTAPVRRVLDALGRPQDQTPPTLHVAGTNGKGSTVAFLRSVCEAHGLRAHVDTSPHLIRVNERIRIAGELVRDDHLLDLIDRVLEANQGGELSFYEGMTVAAFLAFAETEADVTILEVGLGGRFDSTNVIDRPAVSVITPIDVDHVEFFSKNPTQDTLQKQIAWEKAGIIKPGCPVVSAPQKDDVRSVLELEANSLGAPIQFLGDGNEITGSPDRFFYKRNQLRIDGASLSLEGQHQTINAGLALMVLQAADITPMTQAQTIDGLGSARWPARMQKLQPGPVRDLAPDAAVWLDGGHNPHASRAIARKFDQTGGLVVILGMMASKDGTRFLQALAPLNPHLITLPLPDPFNGKAPDSLAADAQKLGLTAAPANDVMQAMTMAAKTGHPDILICGSLYLAGHVLQANNEAID